MDKPRLLDPSFIYRNAASTSIADTWRKAGWKPTTNAERQARRKPKPVPTNVRALKRAAK